LRFRLSSSRPQAALLGAILGLMLGALAATLLIALLAPARAAAQPVTIGAESGLQATLVGEGPADQRLAAAGSNPPGHFLHPIRYRGAVLTELYPADHIHHRGLFWAWRQVLRDGKPLANLWLMQGIALRPLGVKASGNVVRSSARWVAGGEEILEERLLARIDGSRLTIALELHPLVPGLSLGGAPDDKGYGGISLRLVQSEKLGFESAGKPVTATSAPVQAGPDMRFSWDGGAGPVQALTLRCTVDGKPITQWILRRETSMQNCVWPGRTPVPLAMGQPVRLGATLQVIP
jgi:hypothetical protein